MVDTTAFASTAATSIAATSTTLTGGTATIATAGTRTTLPRIGNGSSVSNIAPAIQDFIIVQGQGPIVFLEERAAILSERADQAAAFARDAAADAQDFNNAHASIVAKHRKMFLQRGFGINPDGTAITNGSLLPGKLKKYKSVKTVKQYDEILRVLNNWGDNTVLKNPHLMTVKQLHS